MKKFFPKNAVTWGIYLLLVFIAFFIRFHQLGDESFWMDEIFSAVIVEGDLNEIIDRIPKDKPPLDYYFQAITAPLGTPEFSHRIPAVISGVLAVMGVFAFGSLVGGRRVGMLAMIMAVGSDFLLHYSREARPYMPFTAMLCWQTAFFFLWWRLGKHQKFVKQTLLCLIPILFLSIMMVYTLYAAFIIFGCQILFLLADTFINTSRGKKLLPSGKSFLSYLIIFGLVILSTIPLRSRSDLHVPEDYYYRFMGYSFDLFIGIIRSSFFLNCPNPLITPINILVTAMVLLGLYACWHYRKRGTGYLVLTGTFANLAIVILYEYINRSFCIRYVIYGAPSLLVMNALFLNLLGNSRMLSRYWGHAIAVFLAGLFAITGITFFQMRRPFRHGWLEAVQFVCEKAQPGDLMVIPGTAEYIPVHYYRHRFNREDMDIYLSGYFIPPGNTNIWNFIWEGGDHYQQVGFNGITVEKITRTIPTEPAEEMVTQLTKPNLFIPGEVPTTLLGEGWSGKEDWGGEWNIRWAISRHSVIYFPLSQPSDGTFEVRLSGYTYEDAPEQTTTLVLNGKSCENKIVPLDQGFVTLSWKVSKEQLAQGHNTLEFYFKWCHSPKDDRKNYGDNRALTAAFESIRWVPEQNGE